MMGRPRKNPIQKKPITKRKVKPVPQPIPEEPEFPEDFDEMVDEDGFEIPQNINGKSQGKDHFDRITDPAKSIFDKELDFKRGGDSFNSYTDGVMFNPAEPSLAFDSEWVRFLNQLSADETLKSLSDYIRIAPLTRRGKYKLMVYIKILLDREFTMSNLTGKSDVESLSLDKLLIDADLPLGLTRFDLSPEFQHIINLVRIKFGIKSRRSLFGFERISVNTQRQVQETNDGGDGSMEVKRNITDRIKDLFRGG